MKTLWEIFLKAFIHSLKKYLNWVPTMRQEAWEEGVKKLNDFLFTRQWQEQNMNKLYTDLQKGWGGGGGDILLKLQARSLYISQ